MNKLRWRLARLLVGPIAFVPEPDGVYVVIREQDATMTLTADKFRLKSGVNLTPKAFGDPALMEQWGLSRRWGRFVGTVAYR